MAQMFPKNIPSKATKGEKKLFELLKSLPNDCDVFYEPYVDGCCPDFVVMSPRFGVMIIEVKDWEIQTINRGLHDPKLPLNQARGYAFSLINMFENEHSESCVIQKDGPFKGKLPFPVGSMVLLTNITGGLGDPRFPQKTTMTKEIFDNLLATQTEENKLLEEAIKGYLSLANFADTYSNSDAGEKERHIDYFRAVLYPSYAEGLKVKLAQLDFAMREKANKIGGGLRWVRGVSGSGKTIMLIAKAKAFVDVNKDKKILVTCFNAPLAAFLEKSLEDYKSSVNVSHCNAIYAKFKPKDGTFDMILVDEAQDFLEENIKYVKQKLKGNGELLLFADISQDIYARKNKDIWESEFLEGEIPFEDNYRAIAMDDISEELNTNYRCSAEISEFASKFVNSTEKSMRPTGIKPLLVYRDDEPALRAFTVETVLSLLKGTYPGFYFPLQPEEIGILYPHVYENDAIEKLAEELKTASNENVVWLREDKNKKIDDRAKSCEPGLKISTISSSKGLQFRAVIIFNAQQIGILDPSQREETKKLVAEKLQQAIDKEREASVKAQESRDKEQEARNKLFGADIEESQKLEDEGMALFGESVAIENEAEKLSTIAYELRCEIAKLQAELKEEYYDRLMYVGATRAEDILVLACHGKSTGFAKGLSGLNEYIESEEEAAAKDEKWRLEEIKEAYRQFREVMDANFPSLR